MRSTPCVLHKNIFGGAISGVMLHAFYGRAFPGVNTSARTTTRKRMKHDEQVIEQRQIDSQSKFHHIRFPNAPALARAARCNTSHPHPKTTLELTLTAHSITSAPQNLFNKCISQPAALHSLPRTLCKLPLASHFVTSPSQNIFIGLRTTAFYASLKTLCKLLLTLDCVTPAPPRESLNCI